MNFPNLWKFQRKDLLQIEIVLENIAEIVQVVNAEFQVVVKQLASFQKKNLEAQGIIAKQRWRIFLLVRKL